MRNPIHRVGDAGIMRIDELTLRAFTSDLLYPNQDPTALARHRGRLGAGSVAAEGDGLTMSVHCWLVRLPGRTVLIDTGTGNGKVRSISALSELDEPFLARLAVAGIEPRDVDYVLLTHLHNDHVGWNTYRSGDAWMPTFPRARHLLSRNENAYVAAVAAGSEPDPQGLAPDIGPMLHRPNVDFYDDSVRPVIDAGLVDFVAVDGREVLDGFSFLPSPGPSIDHASIRLVSRGEEALFLGDVMHHPLQVYEPGLRSCFCEFPQAAERSRRSMLAHAAENGMPVFTTHFAESSAGLVRRDGRGFAWSFL